jgi:hypothetical protein
MRADRQMDGTILIGTPNAPADSEWQSEFVPGVFRKQIQKLYTEMYVENVGLHTCKLYERVCL